VTSNNKKLSKLAYGLRKDVLQMIYDGGSGHCGGSLSVMDILTVLFFHVMNIDPQNPLWPERDRFVLSKGHACPALYGALAKRGFFQNTELKQFRKIGSMLRGHPENGVPGIETVTGSLGQGFAVALGMAMGLKKKGGPQRVYCVLGDGEIQEGMVWETAMTAAHYQLDNFTCFLDYNRLQGDGQISEIMDIEPVVEKWNAFKWHTKEIDGHDIEQIIDAIEWAKSAKEHPQIIIAHTVKGKGVSFMENVPAWHGTAPPTPEELCVALKELSSIEEDI
jgi:transketolase